MSRRVPRACRRAHSSRTRATNTPCRIAGSLWTLSPTRASPLVFTSLALRRSASNLPSNNQFARLPANGGLRWLGRSFLPNAPRTVPSARSQQPCAANSTWSHDNASSHAGSSHPEARQPPITPGFLFAPTLPMPPRHAALALWAIDRRLGNTVASTPSLCRRQLWYTAAPGFNAAPLPP